MGIYGGPKIFNDFDLADMQWYMDITNPDCWNGTAISNDPTTKLYNLADQTGTQYFRTYDSLGTSTNYGLSRQYIQRKYGTDGIANTNWRSATDSGDLNVPAFDSGTTGQKSGIVFFKGSLGSGKQGSQNIYLGGYNSRMSFSMAGSGTSNWGGVLVYDNSGNGSWHRTHGASNLMDGEWHSQGFTVTGGSVVTIKLYHDGVLVSSGTYSFNGKNLPYGNRRLIMGGWSTGYGEFTGEYGNWMWFNTELDATDFKQIHNAFKNKYGI